MTTSTATNRRNAVSTQVKFFLEQLESVLQKDSGQVYTHLESGLQVPTVKLIAHTAAFANMIPDNATGTDLRRLYPADIQPTIWKVVHENKIYYHSIVGDLTVIIRLAEISGGLQVDALVHHAVNCVSVIAVDFGMVNVHRDAALYAILLSALDREVLMDVAEDDPFVLNAEEAVLVYAYGDMHQGLVNYDEIEVATKQ